MDFRPLDTEERRKLMDALRGNVQSDTTLLMGRDTSFLGEADEATDDEVIGAIRSVPCHYANAAYVSATSNNGTTTASFPTNSGIPGVTPNLCSLQISQSGGSVGPNAKVTIWDGPIGTGAVIYQAWLSSPGAPVMSAPGVVTGGLGGSVGIIQDIPLPVSPQGLRGIQATPGNQMNIQVTGTGANNTAINARFSDGLP